MTTSKRLAERKVAKFQKNITRRGSVPETSTKKGYDYPVGPIVLGLFVFVVIGSCHGYRAEIMALLFIMLTQIPYTVAILCVALFALFQIIRTATSGGMA